jgi:hypothetical protein
MESYDTRKHTSGSQLIIVTSPKTSSSSRYSTDIRANIFPIFVRPSPRYRKISALQPSILVIIDKFENVIDFVTLKIHDPTPKNEQEEAVQSKLGWGK